MGGIYYRHEKISSARLLQVTGRRIGGRSRMVGYRPNTRPVNRRNGGG